MSVQSEITRLQNAKAAIKTAIEGKGVTVPDGTLLDGMASLIESIEAGGGGGAGNIAYGTITPVDASSHLEIVHGLGKIPDFFCIVASDNSNSVYSRSSPYGQSFLYVIRGDYGGFDNWYLGRYQYNNSVNYSSGTIIDNLKTGLNYYVALGENNAIWANRNSTYGLCDTPAPFFWVAIAYKGIVQ